MTGHRHSEIVDQLVEYWRGNPPADGAARHRCRRIEERLNRLLPAAEARVLQTAPERHRADIERALARLAETDLE
ncbi:MAG: hypothetical protein QOJ16_3426 [Acidobacteriota bacterium]|jgi:hypothetical protein|nr:hypothetical protein [Acidobacteriota bacterium]